jgi:putative addiction module component (TIGR02574 family)
VGEVLLFPSTSLADCGDSAMTVARGFLVVILSGFAFALGGGSIGYSLAVVLPGYYRGVFSSGREPWFDPMEVGIGLGAAQGLICGLIVGAVVVLAVAWFNSRRSPLDVMLSSAKRQELQRRLADHAANLDDVISWEQLKTEALAKFRK